MHGLRRQQRWPALACFSGVQIAQQAAPSPPLRWLYLAGTRPVWSPARHATFPPRFRAAAHTLLLCAARRGVQLPARALRALLGASAYPLSVWRPAVVEGAAGADALYAVFAAGGPLTLSVRVWR